jgi:hypothetical protein
MVLEQEKKNELKHSLKTTANLCFKSSTKETSMDPENCRRYKIKA